MLRDNSVDEVYFNINSFLRAGTEMKQPYRDIIEAVGKHPLWWDEVGAPRFCEFHPQYLNDPYAREGVLLLIGCQECLKEYAVALSWNPMNIYSMEAFDALEVAKKAKVDPPPEAWPAMSLTQLIDAGHQLDYGDPPFACGDNCLAGYSMSSNTLKILQVWVREKSAWTKQPKYTQGYQNPIEDR